MFQRSNLKNILDCSINRMFWMFQRSNLKNILIYRMLQFTKFSSLPNPLPRQHLRMLPISLLYSDVA